MEYYVYSLLALLIIGWSINPYLMKHSIGKLNQPQYLFLKLVTIIVIFFLMYLFNILSFSKDCENIVRTFTKNQLYWFLASTFVTITTSILFITLLKNNNVSFIIPHAKPLAIIVTLLFGSCFFKDKLNIQQLFGVSLVVFGLIIINYFK